MKIHVIFTILVLMVAQVKAQQEVSTTVIKLKDLITHAADVYPNEEPQQIYLLVEVGTSGIDTDNRFFLEQGVQLLLKRLQPEDKIAIGTYGASNGTVLAYTEASNALQVMKELYTLYTTDTQDQEKDGIDIAYQFAKGYYVEGSENKVIMLRNDQVEANVVATASIKEKKNKKTREEHQEAGKSYKLGGAIAITALSILPEILEVIKD
ncbi:hypothetical protein [Dokdonia sp.]|uniref:hypothetical protein n=1 Tax=Dokdonia sp. TaxID=2024995 RepID=UPI0032650D65